MSRYSYNWLWSLPNAKLDKIPCFNTVWFGWFWIFNHFTDTNTFGISAWVDFWEPYEIGLISFPLFSNVRLSVKELFPFYSNSVEYELWDQDWRIKYCAIYTYVIKTSMGFRWCNALRNIYGGNDTLSYRAESWARLEIVHSFNSFRDNCINKICENLQKSRHHSN